MAFVPDMRQDHVAITRHELDPDCLVCLQDARGLTHHLDPAIINMFEIVSLATLLAGNALLQRGP